MNLGDFKGNYLSEEEKEYRIKILKEELEKGDIYQEMVPYLHRLNAFDILMTCQCCTGHGENPREGGRKAHIDLRCMIEIDQVMDKVLRPIYNEHGISITLALEEERLRYVIWFNNESYREEMEYLIELFNKLNEEHLEIKEMFKEDREKHHE